MLDYVISIEINVILSISFANNNLTINYSFMRCCFQTFKELCDFLCRPYSIVNQWFISIGDAKVGAFANSFQIFLFYFEEYFIAVPHTSKYDIKLIDIQLFITKTSF